jgi:hypothetical protein
MNWVVEPFEKSKRLANGRHWEKKRKKKGGKIVMYVSCHMFTNITFYFQLESNHDLYGSVHKVTFALTISNMA